MTTDELAYEEYIAPTEEEMAVIQAELHLEAEEVARHRAWQDAHPGIEIPDFEEMPF